MYSLCFRIHCSKKPHTVNRFGEVYGCPRGCDLCVKTVLNNIKSSVPLTPNVEKRTNFSSKLSSSINFFIRRDVGAYFDQMMSCSVLPALSSYLVLVKTSVCSRQDHRKASVMPVSLCETAFTTSAPAELPI